MPACSVACVRASVSACWAVLRCTGTDARVCAGKPFSVAAWPVEQGAGFFRHFRILQTGKNSSDHDHLMCTGIELYGTLRGRADD